MVSITPAFVDAHEHDIRFALGFVARALVTSARPFVCHRRRPYKRSVPYHFVFHRSRSEKVEEELERAAGRVNPNAYPLFVRLTRVHSYQFHAALLQAATCECARDVPHTRNSHRAFPLDYYFR